MIDSPQFSSLQIGTTLAVVVIVVCGFSYIAARLKRVFRRWAFGAARVHIQHAWVDVDELMVRSDDMSARLAVMHADAVLDKALQARHFPGDRFATRLQYAQRKYRTLRKVWWAHKLRNELAHETDRTLRLPEARRAVAAFKSALMDLGAL